MADLLVVDDEVMLCEMYARALSRAGHRVRQAHSGASALRAYREQRPDLMLLDLRLPDMSGLALLEEIRHEQPIVIMISGDADIPHAVTAVQSGVENFLTKPVDMGVLVIAVEKGLESLRLRKLASYLTQQRASSGRVAIGSSDQMQEVASLVERLAASDGTAVLVRGEPGTGKSRVAELLHAVSGRAGGPFVEVHCATRSAEALDVELFGIEDLQSGTRTGLIDVAARGTLFLDEVAEFPLALQAKLLRVVEGKGFRRVGGTTELSSNVRIVAATTRDLIAEVNAGRLREDLYYRLSVMPVELPPLRARSVEDRVELIGRLVSELSNGLPSAPRETSAEALDLLLQYAWPGNIRELRNVLERAMILSLGRTRIEVEALAPEVRRPAVAAATEPPTTLAAMERQHIERTLRAYDGNRTHSARALGIARATLIKKIREYQLEHEATDLEGT